MNSGNASEHLAVPGEEQPTVLLEGKYSTSAETPQTTPASASKIESTTPTTGSDFEAERRTIRRAMRIGLWVWPAFTALDAYMCIVLYPDAPFALFVVYRFVVELVLFAGYRATLHPEVRLEWLVQGQHVAYFLAAFFISLMAIHLGGLLSVYMHGISLVCLVYAAVMPEPWQRSSVTFTLIGLIFPAVMVSTAVISPHARQEWGTTASLAVFASNYIFVIASSIVGAVCGHAVWAARQQVYRLRQLGRYRLQAPIGSGGMGEVWLAWDGILKRNVALKLLRVGSSSTPDMVSRFEREAYAASQLKGPHTVHVYDFGASDDGIYYIAMEYLSGLDLGRLVRDYGPLPPARAVHFILQACLSLEEAHNAGIIHRDIKPQNLFVTQAGNDFDFVKLLDFGLARLHGPNIGGELTRTGFVAGGTPAFMAPELWRGATADARSDIYALGATLYYLLAGVLPVEAETRGEFLQAHAGQELVRLSERCKFLLPDQLEAIVMRCLSTFAADRFQSITEFRVALSKTHDPNGWTSVHAETFWKELHTIPARTSPAAGAPAVG